MKLTPRHWAFGALAFLAGDALFRRATSRVPPVVSGGAGSGSGSDPFRAFPSSPSFHSFPSSPEAPVAYLMRSATLVRGLHPSLQLLALEFLRRAYAAGVPVIVASGTRTPAEQAALYAQGRSVPGDIVTPRRPGGSLHQYGLAFDVAPIDPRARDGLGAVLWPFPNDSALWLRLGAIGEALGLVWGGRFEEPDLPHFERPRKC